MTKFQTNFNCTTKQEKEKSQGIIERQHVHRHTGQALTGQKGRLSDACAQGHKYLNILQTFMRTISTFNFFILAQKIYFLNFNVFGVKFKVYVFKTCAQNNDYYYRVRWTWGHEDMTRSQCTYFQRCFKFVSSVLHDK